MQTVLILRHGLLIGWLLVFAGCAFTLLNVDRREATPTEVVSALSDPDSGEIGHAPGQFAKDTAWGWQEYAQVGVMVAAMFLGIPVGAREWRKRRNGK